MSIIVDIVKYLHYVITGKLLATHFHFHFYFLSLKYGVLGEPEKKKNDKESKTKGGLGWIRVLRGQEQDVNSLALYWEPFSSNRYCQVSFITGKLHFYFLSLKYGVRRA